jgi:hypothetical protein
MIVARAADGAEQNRRAVRADLDRGGGHRFAHFFDRDRADRRFDVGEPGMRGVEHAHARQR